MIIPGPTCFIYSVQNLCLNLDAKLLKKITRLKFRRNWVTNDLVIVSKKRLNR